MLADGGLAGEKRVAIARLAMVIVFAAVTEGVPALSGEPGGHILERGLGSSYMAFALLALFAVRRVIGGPPSRLRTFFLEKRRDAGDVRARAAL